MTVLLVEPDGVVVVVSDLAAIAVLGVENLFVLAS